MRVGTARILLGTVALLTGGCIALEPMNEAWQFILGYSMALGAIFTLASGFDARAQHSKSITVSRRQK
jgi:hypothetical protein